MRILAVDDEPEILHLLSRGLKNEYEVETVEWPKAILPSDFSKYDLIILDVNMPKEDGYSICLRIRNEFDGPILFLTAKAPEDDLIYGFSVGADDYIRKPFSLTELRARVAAHIRREHREHTQVLGDGMVSFYLAKRELRVLDVPLKLTKSEYDIALFLFKNHDHVFSKEQIYEEIYGFDKDGNDSAITEHIKNLRRKLKESKADPIETVWGIGYKWKKEENV